MLARTNDKLLRTLPAIRQDEIWRPQLPGTMLREKLIDHRFGENKKFRWRSHEISRIEGLSDAVFAFAVTLLVVSLEVPRTFGDLMYAMRGFGAFAISFTLLFIVWFNQYKFFRRYGLQDNITVLLNGI